MRNKTLILEKNIDNTPKDPRNFISVVECIIKYYITAYHRDCDELSDPSEDWKRKSGLIQEQKIPEDLDAEIRRAFIKQIKMHG